MIYITIFNFANPEKINIYSSNEINYYKMIYNYHGVNP